MRLSPKFRPHRPDSRGQPLEQAITGAEFFKKSYQITGPKIFQTSGAFFLSWFPPHENESCFWAQVEKTSVYINTHTAQSMRAAPTGRESQGKKQPSKLHLCQVRCNLTAFFFILHFYRSDVLCDISEMLCEVFFDGSIPTWQRWQAGRLTLPGPECPHPPPRLPAPFNSGS